jgi:hypothetical protein
VNYPYEDLIEMLEGGIDPGTTKYWEDLLVICPTPGALWLLVGNGLSGLWQGQPTLVRGYSGGELVVRTAEHYITGLRDPDVSIEDVGMGLNNVVGRAIKEWGFYSDDPAQCPGTTFVLVKITREKIVALYGGECMLGILNVRGKAWGSRNDIAIFEQTLDHGHTVRLAKLLETMQREHHPKVNEFYQHKNLREALVNNGRVVLEDFTPGQIAEFLERDMASHEFALDGPVAKARRKFYNNLEFKRSQDPKDQEDKNQIVVIMNGDPRVPDLWGKVEFSKEGLTHFYLGNGGSWPRSLHYMIEGAGRAQFAFDALVPGSAASFFAKLREIEADMQSADYVHGGRRERKFIFGKFKKS